MIFTKSSVAKILAGTKTVTRRTIQRDDELIVVDGKIVEVKRNGRRLYRVGHSYAIQPGRGKSSVGRFLLLSIKKDKLGACSDESARKEGFDTREEFFNSWMIIHRRKDRTDILRDVYELEFQLERKNEE